MPVPARARVFVAGTIAAGGAAIVVSAFEARWPLQLATLALLCAAAVVAELFQVSSDESSLDPVDAPTVSFSSGVHLGAVLIVGPWYAALVAAFGVLAVDGVRRAPLDRLAFNAAGFALATLAGGLTFTLLGGEPGTLALPADVPAVGALALVYAGLNTTLVTTIVALASNIRFWPLLGDTARGEASVVAAEASLGIAFAVLALANPWYVAALLPLLVAVYRAHANLVLMRRETGRALETFANIVDERDAYTYRHSVRVADYVTELAERLGLSGSEVARLRWAGRLHDLGKITVDSAVLQKGASLDADEWAAMRRHPRLSARLLGRFRFATREARAVEYHHERYDGSGYYGIDARTLPAAAHFLIVADTFDAMTTNRPYRRALSREQALVEIERGLGTQFHPAVGKAFIACQRGLDPTTVLTHAELAELRRPLLGTSIWRRVLARRPSAGSFVLAAVLLMLFGAGIGSWMLIGAAALLAALALAHAAKRWSDVRRVRQALAGALGGSEPFERIAEVVEGECDLRWAGLLSWRDADLDGSIEKTWGNAFGAPTETALTSWLIREAELNGEPLFGSEAELGARGSHLALPLRDDGTTRAFLVVSIANHVPAHVRLALVQLADELSGGLLEPGAETERLLREVPAAAAL